MEKVIAVEGNIEYSVLAHNKEHYLVTKMFEDLPKKKFLGLFGKGVSRKYTEINTYSMAVPLYSLFSLFANIKETGSTKTMFEGVEPIKIYEVIDANDNYTFKKDLENMYKSTVDMLGGESKLDFTLTPKNKVVKGFINDGFHDYVVELSNILFRTYYTYRTAPNGILYVGVIKEVGNYTDRDNNKTSSVKMLGISLDVVKLVLAYVDELVEKENK